MIIMKQLENKYNFRFGHNHMSDWTREEYKSLLGFKNHNHINKSNNQLIL